MTSCRTLALSIAAMGAMLIGLGGTGRVAAQDSTPVGSPIVGASSVSVVIRDANDADVGTATFSQNDDDTVTVTVTVTVEVQGLPEGEHGIHIHEYGICDPSGDEPFSTAGSHYNPTSAKHGGPPMDNAHMAAMSGTPEVTTSASPEASTAHAGDLGNITVNADGSGTLTVTTDRFTLSEGPMTLQDLDGSAIVIHANADDLVSDPSGNSGGRIACGVIFPSTGGTPVATS